MSLSIPSIHRDSEEYFRFDTTISFWKALTSSDISFNSTVAKVFFFALPFIAAMETFFELLRAPFTLFNHYCSEEIEPTRQKPKIDPLTAALATPLPFDPEFDASTQEFGNPSPLGKAPQVQTKDDGFLGLPHKSKSSLALTDDFFEDDFGSEYGPNDPTSPYPVT